MKRLSEYQFLAENKSDLRECSCDGSSGMKIYMNIPAIPCINFDNATADFMKALGCIREKVTSADALIRNKSGQIYV